MALGDTSLLPAELEGDFRAAGLTHLMAVSGLVARFQVYCQRGAAQLARPRRPWRDWSVIGPCFWNTISPVFGS
jgi:hypothetical protein